MADTTFVEYTTPVPAAWLNDVNDSTYTTVPANTLAIANHIADTSAAHAASAIANTAAGNIVATDVQAAINELDTEKATLAGLSSQTFSVGTASAAAHALRLDQQQYPWRNRGVNGDMSVSQINGTTAITPTSSGYVIDQYFADISQASKLTFQQVTDAPTGFKNSLKITVNAQYSPLAADYFSLQQPIEGQNVADFSFGTASAKRIATGQYIKGSVAGNYAVVIRNGAVDRNYIGHVAVTTAWQPLVLVIDGDTSGTWGVGNTAGLIWSFDLGSGSNYEGSLNTWQAGNKFSSATAVKFVNQVNGSTLNITGVQLEKVAAGATAGTEFEFLPYAENFKRCEYYWKKIGGVTGLDILFQAYSTGTNGLSTTLTYAQMRANPTKTKVGTWTVSNTGQPAIGGGSNGTVVLQATVSVTGAAYFATADTTTYISLDARM